MGKNYVEKNRDYTGLIYRYLILGLFLGLVWGCKSKLEAVSTLQGPQEDAEISAEVEATSINFESADLTVDEDGSVDAAFSVGSTAGEDCSSLVTAVSDNLNIVKIESIEISGTTPNCIVKITPTSDSSGKVVVTLIITVGEETLKTEIVLNVEAINDPPTISGITNQTIDESSSTSILTFKITDPDDDLDCAKSISASSSAETLVNGSNVFISGNAPDCTMIVTPAVSQSALLLRLIAQELFLLEPLMVCRFQLMAEILLLAKPLPMESTIDSGTTLVNKGAGDGIGHAYTYKTFVDSATGTIFVGSNNGLSISTDNGVSFTLKNTADGLANRFVFTVGIAKNGDVYVITDGGLSKSTDGGVSFTSEKFIAGRHLEFDENGGLYILDHGGIVYKAP